MAIVRRRRSANESGPVAELKILVDSLIKENVKLKRQLARLEMKTLGRAGSVATSGLSSLARKVERAIGSAGVAGRRSRRSSARS
jgi:hypothetical protein